MSAWRTYLLFLFILILPWQLNTYFFADSSYISGVRVDYLAYALYFSDFIWLALLLSYWRERVSPFIKRYSLLFVLSAIVVSLQISVAKYPFWTAYCYFRALQVALSVGIFRSLSRDEGLDLTWAWAATTTIQTILVIFQFLSKSSIGGLWYFAGERTMSLSTPGIAKLAILGEEFLRPYGTFSHPNAMAGFFLVVLLISIPNKLSRDLRCYMNITTTILCLILITLSGSQLALGAALLSLLVLFLKKKSVVLASLSAITAITLWMLTYLTNDDPTSISGRVEGIKATVDIIQKHPLWGVGIGNHLREMSKFPTQKLFMQAQPVHNVLLYAISEIGLGTALFAFWILRRHVPSSLSLIRKNLPLFIAIGITMMGDHYWITSFQNRMLLGAVVGMLAGELFNKPKQTLAIGGLAGQSKNLILQDA